MQLGRLGAVVKEHQPNLEALGDRVPGQRSPCSPSAGYGRAAAERARQRRALEPPVGNWDWRLPSLAAQPGLLIAGRKQVPCGALMASEAGPVCSVCPRARCAPDAGRNP